MVWSDLARKVNEYLKATNRTATVGLFLEAHASYKLNNGGVSVDRGNFIYGSGSGLLSDVEQAGFNVLLPIFIGNISGTYEPNRLPAVLLSDFKVGQLESVLGRDHVYFIEQLLDLYRSRIFGTGTLSIQEEFTVEVLLQSGFPVILETVDSRSEQFNRTADAFTQPVRDYFDRKVADGAEAIRRSKSNVAFWSAIHGVVETLATLPDKVISAGASYVGLNLNTFFFAAAAIAPLLIAWVRKK